MKRKCHENNEFAIVGYLIMCGRIKAGLTQKELAERSGVSQADISRFESGLYDISLGLLHRMIVAMGLDLDISLVDPKEIKE